jgi:hypothetical protein
LLILSTGKLPAEPHEVFRMKLLRAQFGLEVKLCEKSGASIRSE